MKQLLRDLPKGARFIGPDRKTIYRVLCPYAETGWRVDVFNESMTDAEAADRIASGAVEEGYDPRGGFFAYTTPVEVEVLPS